MSQPDWVPPGAPPLKHGRRYCCSTCWNLCAPRIDGGVWDGKDNVTKHLLQGQSEWGKASCGNCKTTITKESDVVLVQKTAASPCFIGKVADVPKFGGTRKMISKLKREAKSGSRLKPSWFPWVRLRPPPDAMRPGMTAALCSDAEGGKGKGCPRGDGGCTFAHSQEEADYWTQCVSQDAVQLERVDGALVIEGTPGTKFTVDSKAHVLGDDGVKYTLSDYDRQHNLEYALKDHNIAKIDNATFDQNGCCRRLVSFDKPASGRQATTVTILKAQERIVSTPQPGQQYGSLKIIGGTPGEVPHRGCNAVLVAEDSGTEYEYAMDSTLVHNLDFILNPMEENKVPAFTVYCDANGTYTRPAVFQLNPQGKVVYVQIDPNPSALKNMQICKNVGSCDSRTCSSAHSEAQATRAIDQFARKHNNEEGRKCAQYNFDELQHTGRLNLLQYTRLCRDFIDAKGYCERTASGQRCTYAHSQKEAEDAIERCSQQGAYTGFDGDRMKDQLYTDLTRREQNVGYLAPAAVELQPDDRAIPVEKIRSVDFPSIAPMPVEKIRSADFPSIDAVGTSTGTIRNGNAWNSRDGGGPANASGGPANASGGTPTAAVRRGVYFLQNGNSVLPFDRMVSFDAPSTSLDTIISPQFTSVFGRGPSLAEQAEKADPLRLDSSRASSPDIVPLTEGLEKTEMCPAWMAAKPCVESEDCTYAHTPDEADTQITLKVALRGDRKKLLVKLDNAEATRLHAETKIGAGGGDDAGPKFERLDQSRLEFELEMKPETGKYGYKFVAGENSQVWHGRYTFEEAQKGGGSKTMTAACVIKKVDPTISKDELRILQQCKDKQMPNICKLLDFYEAGNGSPRSPFENYVALEKCDMTLSQALKRNSHMVTDNFGQDGPSFDQRVEWCLGMVAGLLSLHKIDIAHRDFKPSNVLLKLEGGKWVVKIADFGCSRQVTAETRDATLQSTLHGYTKTWCAREVLKRRMTDMPTHETRDKFTMQSWYRADIFALGCTLYHCLARQQSNEAGSEVGKPLATHPFGQTVDIDSNIVNSAYPRGERDLRDSWLDHPSCGTARRNQITARLHDAWRLIFSMLNHKASRRPTAIDVSERMEKEGLMNTDSMVRVGVFYHGNVKFGPPVGNPRLLKVTEHDTHRDSVQWLNTSQEMHYWPSREARDWIQAFTPPEQQLLRAFMVKDDGTDWYRGNQPWQVFRCARNIIAHINDRTLRAKFRAIFADQEEHRAYEAQGGMNFYEKAVADFFSCRFPVLVDLLWDGLPDSPELKHELGGKK